MRLFAPRGSSDEGELTGKEARTPEESPREVQPTESEPQPEAKAPSEQRSLRSVTGAVSRSGDAIFEYLREQQFAAPQQKFRLVEGNSAAVKSGLQPIDPTCLPAIVRRVPAAANEGGPRIDVVPPDIVEELGSYVRIAP